MSKTLGDETEAEFRGSISSELQESQIARWPAAGLDRKTKLQIAQYAFLGHEPYLTRADTAIYLDVPVSSIADWAARPPDENPFPERHLAGKQRTKREDIDKWVEREAQRQSLRHDPGEQVGID